MGDLDNGQDNRLLLTKINIKDVIRILLDPGTVVADCQDVTYYYSTHYLYDDYRSTIIDIIPTAMRAYEDYYQQQMKPEPVLILHCRHGMSRSVCVAAFVLVKEGVCEDLDDALVLIASKRPEIYPNDYFLQQLL